MKCQISIDEKWPVFTLEHVRNPNDPFVVDINEDFYKEYCCLMYKYHEFQIRMQLIYEHQQSNINKQVCGYTVPEGSIVDTEFKPNTIRTTDVSEENVRAVSS